MGERTTIPLSTDTRDKIKSLKRGGESYDNVVKKLIDGDYPHEG